MYVKTVCSGHGHMLAMLQFNIATNCEFQLRAESLVQVDVDIACVLCKMVDVLHLKTNLMFKHVLRHMLIKTEFQFLASFPNT